jgi:hypothetical protein
MASNAQRQAQFKARQRIQGLRQLVVWVNEEQAKAIKAYVNGSFNIAPEVTGNTDSVGRPPKASKKRKPSANSLVLNAHRADILKRIRNGERPSEIVAWLRQFGYTDSPGAFNSSFGFEVFEARRAKPRST